MTAMIPARCLGCGKFAPGGALLCGVCLRTLEHVCLGKSRQSRHLARSIEARERQIPGRENVRAYDCPVCETWHTGRTSGLGEVAYADAVLIGLRLRRFYHAYLSELAESWRNADRAAWRTEVSPRRITAEEASRDGHQDALPA
jgi:hypothetical protein